MYIPEYFRKLQDQTPPTSEPPQLPGRSSDPTPMKLPLVVFKADKFTINIYEDWQNKTIYTLTGPVTNGIQHNIIININYYVQFETLLKFARWRIKDLEDELKGC